ncbi:MAG TPA: FixH family protein [Thermoanaerobaculia bacterium]|nr:FixH family protein [Thermoanaerobaculia bacterium]
MTPRDPARRRSALIIRAALAAAALAVLFIFRGLIIAWFTGQPVGGGTSRTASARAGALTIDAALTPDPPHERANALLLTVKDAGGKPVDDAEIRVAFGMAAMGSMPAMHSDARVRREGAGRYRAEFDLPMAGTWNPEVTIRSARGSATAHYSLTTGSKGLNSLDAEASGGAAPAGAGPGSAPQGSPPAAAAAPGGDIGDIAYYTCSMHPAVRQKAPGTCPICDMKLIRVRRDEAQSGVVTLDDGRQQEIGLRTGVVVRGPLADRITTVGRVAYDESRLHDVSVKFAGWIGKLYVDQTGQRVRKGQILFTLYSPELYGAEQELLASLESQRAARASAVPERVDYLVEAARQKLRLWDLGDGEIRRIAERGAPEKEVPIPSPAAGLVVEKDVVQGASVQPGMKLFRIAGLDRVWVEAEVYEADLGRVRPGGPATVTLRALPGRQLHGRVTLVEPALAAASRTARVRIEVSDPSGGAGPELRPDMYADVELLGGGRQALLVPESAVLYTGPRTIVFVDEGGGRFRQREVHLGAKSGGAYEVVAGLREGDRVVTSGNFLLDAESRLTSAGEGGS